MTKKVEIVVSAKDQASDKFKKIWKSSKSLASTIKANMWKIRIASGIAVAGFVAMWKSFLDTGTKLELMNKKADVVLGEFRKDVEKTAKVVATRMGLTNMQFVEATTSITDLLVPMGFARKEAVSMSTDMTKLAGALAEWSWGKYNAIEASEILAKAMLGETEQMKSMGIKIDQTSKGFNERVKAIMEDKNMTLEQAKAMEIQNQIFAKSVDAQTAYANGAGSLADQQWRLKIQLQNIKETISLALIPAFNTVLEAISPIITKISERIQENPKLTKNILLVVAWLTSLVFWLTIAVPAITAVSTAMTFMLGPVWLIITAIWLLTVWMYKLFTAFPTYEERVQWLKAQMASLDEQYANGIITQEQYWQQMSVLQDNMVQLEEKSKTFWGSMRNDLAETFYNIKNTPQFLNETFTAIGWYFDKFAWYVASKIQWLWDTVFWYFTDKIEWILWTVQKARDKVQWFMSKAKSATSNVLSGVWIGSWSRASWGNVQAGNSYKVWERGEETFVPKQDGRIVPNNAGGAEININMGGVSVNNGQDAQSLANTIAETIKRETQLFNMWIN